MSITIGDETFDLTYVNVGSDFVEQPGAVLEEDSWGMDSITRRFAGRLDKSNTELLKYRGKRNVADLIHPDLFVVKTRMTEDAPFAMLEVSYRGVIGGKPRDPEVTTNKRVQSVTLRFTGDTPGESDGTTATLKYYAPFATCRYATRKRVLDAKYKNKVSLGEIEIIGITGDDMKDLAIKRGPSFNGATSASTVLTGLANTFNATAEIIGIVESKPAGQWFENTETIEVNILPLGLTQAKRAVKNS